MKKIILTLSLASACVCAYAQSESQALSPKPQRDYDRIRFAVDGGYTYMLGQNASEWDGKDMWSGFTLGTDLCMMIKKDIGIGAKVNYRNQTKAFPYEYGTLTLKRNYWFVGPEFIYRPRTFNNKGAGIFGVALGYAGTHQTMISNKIMAASIGVVLDAGYEAKIGKSAAFMVKFSLIGGSAGKAKLTDPYGSSNKIRLEGQRESLSSVNITLGLVFGR